MSSPSSFRSSTRASDRRIGNVADHEPMQAAVGRPAFVGIALQQFEHRPPNGTIRRRAGDRIRSKIAGNAEFDPAAAGQMRSDEREQHQRP